MWPFIAVSVVLIVIFLVYSYRWTNTQHGRLDYAVALSLRLFTFQYKMQPDPEHELTVAVPANLAFMLDLLLPKARVGKTEDRKIPGEGVEVPVRVYWPSGYDSAPPLPIIVFFHGGGFMLANIDVYERFTRTLASENNSIVISVGYRLTPVHPFPAGLVDAYGVVKWAAKNGASLGGDPSLLIVAGDSAGGNLATVITQKARDEHGPRIAAQVLYYPVVDLSEQDYPSYQFWNGYGLTKALSDVYTEAYVGHLEDKSTPHASPLYATSVEGLPPALVITAGFDPLTDAALLYVKRLQQAGVPVTAIHYPSTIHGFMNAPVFAQRKQAFAETQRFLADVGSRIPHRQH